jgi:uncharacterized protein YceH (UPF0502 family)
VLPTHGERTIKLRHVLDERLDVDRRGLAVLAVLALRGPQTVAELRSRTERAYAFDSVEELEELLGHLAAREEPLVVELPRRRWMHLLGGPVDVDALAAHTAPTTARPPSPSSDRVAALEAEVAELRGRIDRLERELVRELGLQLPS